MSNLDRPVVRCTCFDVTFTEMLASGIQSVEEAAERWGCSTNCGLCRPYIKRALQTRETEHAVLPD